MRHLVITIGCEYGAKGNAIGRKIAEDLNIKFYNRELVDEIIEEVGIPKEIMEKVEELTLYVIQLNKENQQLKQEVETLRKIVENK